MYKYGHMALIIFRAHKVSEESEEEEELKEEDEYDYY